MRARERGEAEALDVEPVGKLEPALAGTRPRRSPRTVIVLAALVQREHATDELGVDEGTVGGDAQDRVGVELLAAR